MGGNGIVEFKIKGQVYKYHIGANSVRVQFPEGKSVIIFKSDIHENFDSKFNQKKLIKKFIKNNY